MNIKMISISIVSMLVLVGFFSISIFENNEAGAWAKDEKARKASWISKTKL